MSILKLQFASPCQAVAHSRYNAKPLSYRIIQVHRLISNSPKLIFSYPSCLTLYNSSNHQLTLKTRRKCQDALAVAITTYHGDGDSCSLKSDRNPHEGQEQAQDKSFWGAVGLIIGTAVGPGMLGLPAATLRAGPLPSTIAILLSWVYVISSIILVAELSFAAMEQDGVSEVSFTGLATKGLGSRAGAFVALVYSSLSFSLLVACVSGIGSIVSQWFPGMNPLIVHASFPFGVGIMLWLFPFKIIDAANRGLCLIMLFSISALVVFGLSVGRMYIMSSFAYASWNLSSVLPAMPVTVLTLGFHVITPFICKIAGNSVDEARKAILLGGVVPLIMVLVWNLIVLGLAGTNTTPPFKDPISLLLSVNPSALAAVQGFAFSALATSFIGYAVSFPKQVLDTLELIFGKHNVSPSQAHLTNYEGGKVGFATYSRGCNVGNIGNAFFRRSTHTLSSEVTLVPGFGNLRSIITPLVLGMPVLIASFFPSTFSRALDFAGVYANCFLFGILPPVITYMYQSKRMTRSSILPGGDGALLLLFSISVILGIWH